MESLTNIYKEHQRQVGKWCKRASWAVAAVGLLIVVLNGYNALIVNYGSLIQVALNMLSGVPSIIFYFFVLQAAGVMLDRPFGEP